MASSDDSSDVDSVSSVWSELFSPVTDQPPATGDCTFPVQHPRAGGKEDVQIVPEEEGWQEDEEETVGDQETDDGELAGDEEGEEAEEVHRDVEGKEGDEASPTGTRKVVELLATCPHCGKQFYGVKSFGVLSNYHRHLRTHNNERPYECETCGKKFKTPSNLKRHKRIHEEAAIPLHNRRDKPRFRCDECGKTYASQWSLTQHQRRQHWDQRDEVDCPACGQSLSSASKLRRHQKYHCIFRDNSDDNDDGDENSNDDEEEEETENGGGEGEVSATNGVESERSDESEEEAAWGQGGIDERGPISTHNYNHSGSGRVLKPNPLDEMSTSEDEDDDGEVREDVELRPQMDQGRGATLGHRRRASAAAVVQVSRADVRRRVIQRKRGREGDQASEDEDALSQQSKIFFCSKSIDCAASFRSLRALKAHIRRCHLPPKEENRGSSDDDGGDDRGHDDDDGVSQGGEL